MSMDLEKECTLLGNLFHHIVTDLKSSSPAWDDFVSKGTKLHSLLKSVTVTLFAFTESIQKIADLATNTKGSTKDVGSALTRICVRQKMVENKLKNFTNSLMDNLLCPVQERLEEWKKVANQLEKDHSKDYKRATQEIKKRNSDTMRLQKKARKGSKPDLHVQLNSAMHDVNERFAILEETEKSALRNLLVEERSRICFFANCLSPVMDLQVSILNEASHLHNLSDDMSKLCRNPKQLPTSTEQLVQDYIAAHSEQSPAPHDSHTNGFLDGSIRSTPPSTPTSDDSRKSSICSLNSLTSSDSFSSGSLNRASSIHQRHYQSHHRRNHSGTTFAGGLGSPTSAKSAPVSGQGGPRLSISSHDSGFISTGNGNALPSQYDVTSRLPNSNIPGERIEMASDVVDGNFPIIRGRSQSQQAPGNMLQQNGQNRFSWKDWEKPGPYDLKSSYPNKADSFKDVLPNKSIPPPVLSPKPTSYSHRSSIDESYTCKTPLHRANTAPIIHSLHQNDPFPPPPPNMAPASFDPLDDPLPPPPPSLLDDSLFSPPPNDRTLTEETISYGNPHNDFPGMTRKNSVNSLQNSTSSGYCSQYSTPACSEDTIASQDADFYYGDNYDTGRCADNTYTTLPRSHQNMSRSKTLPRGGLHKRPISTNGLPAKEAITNDIESGTATIRRKPSCKFNSIRRSSSGPKAVAPPTVPFFPPSPAVFASSNYANYNNSNNLGSSVSSYDQQRQSLNRDLTLQFQQTPDFRGDSPTPTSTPVVGDPGLSYIPFSAPLSSTSNPDRLQD